MTNINAQNFEDGKALNKALKAAESVVSNLHMDDNFSSKAVSDLLAQLRALLDHNEKQADELR